MSTSLPDFNTYNVGELIEQLSRVKEIKASLAVREKELNAEQGLIESALIKKMEDIGTNKAASPNGFGSITLATDTVADVLDWDVLHSHIQKTGDFSLLQRRVSVTSYREALSLGVEVPGVAPREIKKINYRSS